MLACRYFRATAGSPDCIVATFAFDGYGRQYKVTDNAGHETRTFFDSLGRVTKTIQNYKDGSPTTASPGQAFATDQDVTTEYAYNAMGLLETQTAVNVKVVGSTPTAFDQTTTYVYSGDLSADHKGCLVPRNDLLRATIKPDSSQNQAAVISVLNAGSGTHDFVEYTYHANGTLAAKTDQRGVTHGYTYLCPCQLGRGDFWGFAGCRGRRGTGWRSCAHKSLAA